MNDRFDALGAFDDLRAQLDLEQPQALISFPKLVRGDRMLSCRIPMPAEIISGILSRGEKGELAGGSKAYKTWTLIHQALAVASGQPWWGFPTQANNVIFLNLEIPQPFFEERVRVVAAAIDLEIPNTFHVWHLRRAKLGERSRWIAFLAELKEQCTFIANPYLTSDPIYKLLGGKNENAAGDVQLLLEQLDDMIETVDGANFFGHHFSKGNQSGKEAIDRASGSGVFQRDPDSIFTMTAHEKEGCFTVDAILRNHPPIDPFVVQWSYPVFVKNPILDPTELKCPKTRQNAKYDIHMLAYWLGDQSLSTTAFCKLLKQETGMSESTFFELIKAAEAAKLIARTKNDNKSWSKY